MSPSLLDFPASHHTPHLRAVPPLHPARLGPTLRRGDVPARWAGRIRALVDDLQHRDPGTGVLDATTHAVAALLEDLRAACDREPFGVARACFEMVRHTGWIAEANAELREWESVQEIRLAQLRHDFVALARVALMRFRDGGGRSPGQDQLAVNLLRDFCESTDEEARLALATQWAPLIGPDGVATLLVFPRQFWTERTQSQLVAGLTAGTPTDRLAVWEQFSPARDADTDDLLTEVLEWADMAIEFLRPRSAAGYQLVVEILDDACAHAVGFHGVPEDEARAATAVLARMLADENAAKWRFVEVLDAFAQRQLDAGLVA